MKIDKDEAITVHWNDLSMDMQQMLIDLGYKPSEQQKQQYVEIGKLYLIGEHY